MPRKKYLYYRGFTSRRRFGVELEASNTVNREFIINVIQRNSHHRIKNDGYTQSLGNDYWHLKYDSSCAASFVLGSENKGWEIASFVGSGIRDAQHIGDVAEHLKNAGLEVNNNCGLHVHVEVADFTPKQMGVLLAHWLKVERFMTSVVPLRRKRGIYCEPLYYSFRAIDRSKRWTATCLWNRLRPKNLSSQDNFCRWQSVNLVNYANGLVDSRYKRKTIEFRLPEGSLSKSDVINWVRLFVNFVDFVKYKPMPENIKSVSIENALWYLGIGHNKDNFYILSPGLHATKTWLLERAMTYGTYAVTAKNILKRMWEPVRNYD